MKVAISSAGKDLTSPIDPRFGRCAYFVIVDTETMDQTDKAKEEALRLIREG